MTRKEKIEKRKARAKRRADKHNNRYRKIAQNADWEGIPICGLKGNSWPDENSPTGYSQKCSYIGICQAPCNGDC